jgi:hypothetical protein
MNPTGEGAGMKQAWGWTIAGRAAVVLAWLAGAALPAFAQKPEGAAPRGKQNFEFEGLTPETVKQITDQYARLRKARVGPMAVPDIFGHGSVLTVGKVVQKVTNFGFNGNPFMNTSSDPSAQWPGQSGVEYLFAQTIAVGAVDPTVSVGDPVSRRRVSSGIEWRPPTLNPEDHIYSAYEGIVNGKRFFNDDGDKDLSEPILYLQDKVDEDFLDGRDNDGDGLIDEDYGALGQEMYSLVMRDDTQEAIQFTQAEPHVPRGLEIKEKAWAYSLTALENFNVFEYQITNVSGHELDSLYVGFPIDIDAGPTNISGYYLDDLDIPQFPSGDFTLPIDPADPLAQTKHDPVITDPPPGTPLCSQIDIRINGFTICDDNGDDGKTLGVPSLLLIDHTIDPTGVNGPSRVGFRAFRSYSGGTVYAQGGPPRIDQQRFEFMSGRATGDESSDPHENIDPNTGFINAQGGDQKGDYAAWCSIGPWLRLQPNASISATIAFAVQRCLGNSPYVESSRFPIDYAAWKADSVQNPHGYMSGQEALFSKYPPLKNAYDAYVAFQGVYESRVDGIPSTDWHGRETGIRGVRGGPIYTLADCRDLAEGGAGPREVKPDAYTWFDFDCNYCTGVWNYQLAGSKAPEDRYLGGMLHHTWNASTPPPNPNLNTAANYNFTDNPTRLVAAPGDRKITLAWDNLSQISSNPGLVNNHKNVFDFRGFKVYKVAGWTRPVGSPGPSEDEWALVASFTMFDYRDSIGDPIPNNAIGRKTAPPGAPGDTLIYPKLLFPGQTDSSVVALHRFDLWDDQSGKILHPDFSVGCVKWQKSDSCFQVVAPGDTCNGKCGISFFSPFLPETLIQYPVGVYRYEDTEVKNGFIYFYSVTAFDSSCTKINADGSCAAFIESEGRKSAVEAEGVSPQAATMTGKSVWVVPNPYKGYANITQRPSTWDLTPNATDPTGTHIDFMGLPPGQWTIKIYTIAGDLVQTLKSTDPANASQRGTVLTPTGTYPGYNRQQDTANDGEASWNLISRNGQDIVSGVYLFTVQSSQGIQRGRFVVIR